MIEPNDVSKRIVPQRIIFFVRLTRTLQQHTVSQWQEGVLLYPFHRAGSIDSAMSPVARSPISSVNGTGLADRVRVISTDRTLICEAKTGSRFVISPERKRYL